MGNASVNQTPLNKDNIIIPQNDETEKRTGKSFFNNILGKLELFERIEIKITIIDPLLNISNKIKILNEEILDNVLYDYYPNYKSDIIPTLNGYILSKEISLKENNIQDNDEIYVSEPLEFYFSFSDGNKINVKASKYQIFFDLFQRFRIRECPREYKKRISECYYKEKLIGSFDIIENLGINQNEEIFVVVGIDNNTNSIYDKGLDIINKFNYIYLNNKENQISIHDLKVELNNKTLDNEELLNFSIINFKNLKTLSLIDCKIQTLYFLNTVPLSNLKEINLQKNLISFFEDLNLLKLENFDLSYNTFNKNMLPYNDNNNNNYINEKRYNLYINLPSLKVLNLSNNKIENINVLSQFKMQSLKELNLNNNEIENIDVLNNLTCGRLRRINLSNNKINDIKIFSELSFCNNIEKINVMNNEIINLNILRNVKLPRLKVLNLLNNDIEDYSVFRLIFFPKLETLYAFPSQLDPDNYDKSSEIFKNFDSLCGNIKEKGVEIKYKL